MTDISATSLEAGIVPEEPPREAAVGAGDWVRKNLFSSTGNSILTVVSVLVALAAINWLTNLAYPENWNAVLTNMRLLFSYNYPASQYIRVWFSLGMLLAVVGATLAVWNIRPRLALSKAASSLAGLGILLLLIASYAPELDEAGELIPEAEGSSSFLATLLSPILSLGNPFDHIWFTISALIALALAAVCWFSTSDPEETYISFEALLIGFAAAVLATVWLVKWGQHELVSKAEVEALTPAERAERGMTDEIKAQYVDIPGGTANITTKRPWTIMMAILLTSYFGMRALKNIIPQNPLKGFLGLWWLVGPAFLIFLVLRDPAFDNAHLISTDIPMGLAFMVGGGIILYLLANPKIGELGRQIGAGLLVFAAFNWLAAGLGLQFGNIAIFGWRLANWSSMLQKARISFLVLAIFALLAPTFAGEHRTRLRFAMYWAGTMFLMHWLITGINTPSTLDIQAPPFLGGFTLSLVIFYYTMIVSFPLGVILALGRTSTMPIFRLLSTWYIEFVRGIPLITVLFFFSIMVNLFLPGGMELSELAAVFIGYSLFSAAYLAENVRGGLQSIRRGQFEASDALGLTTLQRTVFIILPQALRVTIPNLVGQAIATFKETSLISIIGGFDFLRVANSSIPNQSEFLGDKIGGILVICFVYWVFSFAMSKASQNLERQLGVGQR